MKIIRDDFYFLDRSSLFIFESVIIKSLCYNLVKINNIFLSFFGRCILKNVMCLWFLKLMNVLVFVLKYFCK